MKVIPIDDPLQRLVVYGSLAPGGPNHHHIAAISGRWRQGWVEGTLHQEGWGAAQGFPGIRLGEGRPRVCVHVLESAELSVHWCRLDMIEGKDYERIVVPVHGFSADSALGYIYALRK